MVLRRGDRGRYVREAQSRLHRHGYLVTSREVDGVFGPGTERAVQRFQKDRGLSIDGVIGPRTLDALNCEPNQLSAPQPIPVILRCIEAAGHSLDWRGDYHLTLFGIRSRERIANKFDDMFGVAYTVDGRWIVETFAATTDPGAYWLKKPGNVQGTAILAAGQYRDVWKIDLHAGKYPALCQRNGKVKVYRDSNRNTILDLDEESLVSGRYGINIHRSSIGESTNVGRWSAGCQVLARGDDFARLMFLAQQQVDKTGIDTFSYTLLEEPVRTLESVGA